MGNNHTICYWSIRGHWLHASPLCQRRPVRYSCTFPAAYYHTLDPMHKYLHWTTFVRLTPIITQLLDDILNYQLLKQFSSSSSRDPYCCKFKDVWFTDYCWKQVTCKVYPSPARSNSYPSFSPIHWGCLNIRDLSIFKRGMCLNILTDDNRLTPRNI